MTVGPPLDLGSLDSVRTFVSSLNGDGGGGRRGGGTQPRPLHVLVNNAGANYLPRGKTPEGVCTLAQVKRSRLQSFANAFLLFTKFANDRQQRRRQIICRGHTPKGVFTLTQVVLCQPGLSIQR